MSRILFFRSSLIIISLSVPFDNHNRLNFTVKFIGQESRRERSSFCQQSPFARAVLFINEPVDAENFLGNLYDLCEFPLATSLGVLEKTLDT